MSSSSSTIRVYLGKIPLDTREREIEKFFKNYGVFGDINIKSGFAFIEFEDRRDAEDAVYDLDGKEFLGSRCVVELAKGYDRSKDRGPPRGDRGGHGDRGGNSGERGDGANRYFSGFDRPYNTEYRVIIEGLSTRTGWRELKDHFRRVGDVTFADAHRHKDGEGIVDFKSRSDMEGAVRKFDDTELDGRRVRVTAQTRDSNSRSRSRSPTKRRSHSRSPRRRRSRS